MATDGDGVKGWASLLVGPGAAAAIGAYAIYFVLTTGAAALNANSVAISDLASAVRATEPKLDAINATLKDGGEKAKQSHHRLLSMELYTCKESAISAAHVTGKSTPDCDEYYRDLFGIGSDDEDSKNGER